MDRAKIKKIVAKYVKKYSTRDPYRLAGCLDIQLFQTFLGNASGFYRYMKRHKCIYLNCNLADETKRLVLAHELGHALLHSRDNTYFMEQNTLLNTSRYEIEANYFAAELLLDDDFISNNKELTISQLIKQTGFTEDILIFRLEAHL